MATNTEFKLIIMRQLINSIDATSIGNERGYMCYGGADQ